MSHCWHTIISFFSHHTALLECHSLSLHDALPIFERVRQRTPACAKVGVFDVDGIFRGKYMAPDKLASALARRSEEHTSELQSPCNIVCRLLLEKKKNVEEDTAGYAKDSI